MKSLLQFRVRYQETDQMGVVHHSVYLIWFEAGRTEWMRERGMSYRKCEERGWLLPVIESGCQYINSARYDDLIEIETEYITEKGATFRFEYIVRIVGDTKILAKGFTRHVCISRRAISEGKIDKETTKLLKEQFNS